MIEVLRLDGLWTVMIDRPEKANSLTRDMLVALAETAEQAQAAHVRAFVLRGRGRVFSAGADIGEARAGLATDPVWERVSGAIAALPCLTIAALNGTLVGGAFGMALACDLRVAVPQARFFYPALALGFLPQPSDPVRLDRLVGPAHARMLLLAGQRIGAEEALAWGLIDRIVAPETLDDAVAELATVALGARAEVLAGLKTMMSAPR